MNTESLNQYQNKESVIHSLNPRVKVLITVLLILSNSIFPDGAWIGFVCTWFLVLFVNHLAGLRPRYLLIRSFIVVPFALAAISVIFTIPGNAIVSIEVGSSVWLVSDAGLIRFASILLRSWISVQAAIVLTATTTFPDLIHALRHLYVPKIIVAIISFMYRYLIVLSSEANRLIRGRQARSALPFLGNGASPRGVGGGSLAWRASVAGNMAGQLFLRGYERSDRVYQAMQARGYQGQILTMNPHEMERMDWIVGLVWVIIIILLQAIARVG
jgi:cobalt/nickel transport system permease protein